jgi:hypothetical protein
MAKLCHWTTTKTEFLEGKLLPTLEKQAFAVEIFVAPFPTHAP